MGLDLAENAIVSRAQEKRGITAHKSKAAKVPTRTRLSCVYRAMKALIKKAVTVANTTPAISMLKLMK